MDKATLCIDIGGSKTRIGFSEDGKNFSDVKIFSTLHDFDEEVKKIIKEASVYGSGIDKVSIGAAGVIDRKEGKLVWWGEHESWWGKSFFEPLKKVYPSVKFAIENDADIACLGEAFFGAGKKYKIVAYITLSTGIGGGLAINGKVPEYKVGFEVGHQIINFRETEAWKCGQKGCFESYASGSAFKKIFGISGESCDDREIWKEYGSMYLAPGIANVIAIWSPEVIILGGGVSNKFDLFIDPLKKELKKIIPFELPEIVRAEFDEPGLYGGLAL